MQRLGNLKVSSVFGFLHLETAVLVFGFQKKKYLFQKFKAENLNRGFGLEAKTGC